MQRQIIPSSDKVYDGGGNMLRKMFEVQGAFHSRMLPYPGVWLGKTNEILLKVTAQAIMMEAAELLEETNWKAWKKVKKEVDWEQVKFEIADIMAFVMNAAMEAGMTHEDLFNYYMRKAEINVKRQEEGY